jgi:YHS domain-containing protein
MEITMTRILGATLAAFAAILLQTAPTPAVAVEPVNTGLFGRTAIDGYDPVAYFVSGRPVKGDKAYTHEWRGALFRFANAKNLAAFQAAPEKYAPQYGGYCAWAVSQGYTAGIDPDAWKIVDGKLYLNYDRDVQKKWERDIPGHVRKADENWPALLRK